MEEVLRPASFTPWLRAAQYGTTDTIHELNEAHAHREHDTAPKTTLEIAARNGHLDVLRWYYDHPEQLGGQGRRLLTHDLVPAMAAASGGHLHVLNWLAGLEGCTPFEGAVCGVATTKGDLGVLQWANDRKPFARQPRDFVERMYQQAKETGHRHITTWLEEVLRRPTATED
ncbi:Ankyrin repeat domain-containing protein [Balamuthia mandrillaris]